VSDALPSNEQVEQLIAEYQLAIDVRSHHTPLGRIDRIKQRCEETVAALRELQERRVEVEKYKAWAASCDPTPPETRDDGWLPISTVPNGHEEFEFWVEPKVPGESYVDTSGTPIVSTGLGFRHIGKYRTWGSLSKATHWRRCPSPPKAEAPREACNHTAAKAKAIRNGLDHIVCVECGKTVSAQKTSAEGQS
jgi:hypothetical protein